MIPIQKQVITLEQAKHLKEMGIEQDSLFYWYKNSDLEYEVGYRSTAMIYEDFNESYSAFTVGELRYMIHEDASIVKELFEDVDFCLMSHKALEDFNRVIKD